MASELKAPFPWFGGKRRVAAQVWDALGNVDHYVEPFCGSAAVLLARPHAPRVETINDADGMVANFWRAVKADPAVVAMHADWPVNEADLHARHRWLIGRRESLTERLVADPLWFDAVVAGWWVWGISCWLGSGWCDAGRGAPSRQIPLLHGWHRGHGIHANDFDLCGVFDSLCARMRNVRVVCGDWQRCLGNTAINPGGGVAGLLFDPPYSEGNADYAAGGTGTDLALRVREWCAEHGADKRLRIVLCGYEGEHEALGALGWRPVAWKAVGGYGNAAGNENAKRERLWLSPACLGDEALPLFGGRAG